MSMFTPPGVGGSKQARRRGRSRRGGRVVLAVLIVATVVAAGAAWWWNSDRGDKPTAAPRPTCPPTQSAPPVVAARAVHLNVYNATKRRGLAGEVAKQLRKRGFVVAKIENDPTNRTVTGIAEVRANPSSGAAVRTVGAQVASFVAVRDQRKDASVDLVLGAAFRTLRTPAAAAAALTPTLAPRPSGC
jgi:hypothetical protein